MKEINIQSDGASKIRVRVFETVNPKISIEFVDQIVGQWAVDNMPVGKACPGVVLSDDNLKKLYDLIGEALKVPLIDAEFPEVGEEKKTTEKESDAEESINLLSPCYGDRLALTSNADGDMVIKDNFHNCIYYIHQNEQRKMLALTSAHLAKHSPNPDTICKNECDDKPLEQRLAAMEDQLWRLNVWKINSVTVSNREQEIISECKEEMKRISERVETIGKRVAERVTKIESELGDEIATVDKETRRLWYWKDEHQGKLEGHEKMFQRLERRIEDVAAQRQMQEQRHARDISNLCTRLNAMDKKVDEMQADFSRNFNGLREDLYVHKILIDEIRKLDEIRKRADGE